MSTHVWAAAGTTSEYDRGEWLPDMEWIECLKSAQVAVRYEAAIAMTLSGTNGRWTAKYPRTPYWPWSPTIGRGESVFANPARLVGEEVVVTEKLDGGNMLLHAGKVYLRSVSAPARAKWLAMVKKHHAWKVTEPDVWLYGEDIYGVHSIEYGPVAEQATFYAFALRCADGTFAAFAEVEDYARPRDIPVVPVLYRGCFQSATSLANFVRQAHEEPSILGGAREGVVIRLARGFAAAEFQNSVCKSVREGHVQTDEHWSRGWKPCRIVGRATL